jgi:mannose-6-phosphate isomerase-like protein (cupin superfamily)
MTSGIIGGIGLTHLRVYDQRPGPDGVMAGCAHVHALTEEAYFCIAGEGAIELHDADKGFRSIPLKKGDYVQFPPNTLHRSVSTDAIEVLAVMGNSGLPERGDARIYFGPDVDGDPEEFKRLKSLASTGLDGALARRDASARAYMKLLTLWQNDRTAYDHELERFAAVHRADLAARKSEFAEAVANGAAGWAEHDAARLDALPGVPEGWSPVLTGEAGAKGVVYGMCGLLRQVDDLVPGR